MSSTLSAEQVRARNELAMGKELGALYTVLSNELVVLHWHWGQYIQLFASSSDRVTLLNRAAPFFFWIVQETTWEATLLSITRLTAPPSSLGKPNLTIQRLPALLDDERVRREVQELVDAAVASATFAKDWRNRHIAHRDLDLSLGRAAQPLAAATKAAVDKSLALLAEVLNHIDMHYFDATMHYDVLDQGGGAESMLYVIRDGLRREELRDQRLKDGQYDPADWDDHLGAV